MSRDRGKLRRVRKFSKLMTTTTMDQDVLFGKESELISVDFDLGAGAVDNAHVCTVDVVDPAGIVTRLLGGTDGTMAVDGQFITYVPPDSGKFPISRNTEQNNAMDMITITVDGTDAGLTMTVIVVTEEAQ